MRGPFALLLAAALAATPAVARAGVVVGEGVPFTEGDLTAALAARDDDAPDEVHVEVPPGPASRVQVTTPAGAWTISLGDARGPSAARLVALHLIDAGTGGATPPPSVQRRSRVAAADLDPPPVDAGTAEPGAHPRPSIRRIAFTFGVGRGTGDDDLSAATWSAEVTVARGRWVGGAALTLQTTAPSEERGAGEPITMSMGQLRALVGVREGRFELVGGPHAGMLFVDEIPGSRVRMMTGLGAAVRFYQPLRPPGWSLQLSAGADGFRHRVMVEASGTPLGSSPRVAFLFNLGLSGVLGR